MGFMDKFKSFIGIDEEYDDDDYYEEEYEEVVVANSDEEEAPKVAPSRSKKGGNNVLNLHSSSQFKICIHEPFSYDESPAIIDDLRLRKAVVLNFEQLDMDLKRQIFDFVNGALYAIDGKIQKVNKDIFILAPSNVEIDGLQEELKNKGIFPW
ncbi:MAG: cell division protein SepF [Tissierellia bacterium]|nr:cell division protein SepF [Tissierellia bacterium]